MSGTGARTVLAALTAAGLLTLTGCAGEEPPSALVPALSDDLDAVDAAIESGDHPAARTALEALVATTTEAAEAGDLDDTRADAILAAAEALEARLPGDEPAPEESTEEPAAPTTSAVPEEEEAEDDSDEEYEGEDSSNGQGKVKGHDDDDDHDD